MLTAESYQTAWAIYVLAGLGLLLSLRIWLIASWSPAKSVTLLLVLAALTLTPSAPGEDASGYAPAVVVFGFELLTNGAESAMESLRALLASLALALALATGFFLFQRFRGGSKE